MAATASKGLQKMMEPFSFEEWRDLVEAWAARKPEAIERVNHLLASAGLTMDAFMLQSFCDNLHAIECIERMITKAEVRRNDALFEIERHRSTFAFTLRRTVQQVEAEYQAGAANSAEQTSVT
jgi:Tfp pilus assembly PilM family ATPase